LLALNKRRKKKKRVKRELRADEDDNSGETEEESMFPGFILPLFWLKPLTFHVEIAVKIGWS